MKAPPLGAVIGFAGLFGLLIGSFLNVVVYRLPRAESVSHPPSHCPRCDARLTALELKDAHIPCTLITDNTAAALMAAGKVNLVIVGADRVTAEGDVANKIGTYGLAVLAKHHGLPFYVAAPTNTVDLSLQSGSQIPIEERSADEVLFVQGKSIAPKGTKALHLAFDVTPHTLISAIVTEKGVARAPYEFALPALLGR